ncbi:MAG: hypothetical protein ACYTEQ_23200 [Planctomycetota bacterium]|jgi:hypothetical protein
MARMTKLQVDHLRHRLRRLVEDYKFKTALYAKIRELNRERARQETCRTDIAGKLTAAEMQAALRYIIENKNAYTCVTVALEKTKEGKARKRKRQTITKRINELEAELGEVMKEIYLEQEQVIDQAVLAGTGPETLEMVNAFMEKLG